MNIATGAWLLSIALLVGNLAGWIALSYWLVFLPVIIVTGLQLTVFLVALAIILRSS